MTTVVPGLTDLASVTGRVSRNGFWYTRTVSLSGAKNSVSDCG